MNRDIIEPGRTRGKFAEAFALAGGVGAVLYPLFFYYVSYTLIYSRNEYLHCTLTEAAAKSAKGESYSVYVRRCIFFNLFMIMVYLTLHFIIYSRPENNETFKKTAIVFAVALAVEIAGALIVFFFIGLSICKSNAYGVAGIISALAIIIINGLTITFATIFFLLKTKPKSAQIAAEQSGSAVAVDRSADVTSDFGNNVSRQA